MPKSASFIVSFANQSENLRLEVNQIYTFNSFQQVNFAVLNHGIGRGYMNKYHELGGWHPDVWKNYLYVLVVLLKMTWLLCIFCFIVLRILFISCDCQKYSYEEVRLGFITVLIVLDVASVTSSRKYGSRLFALMQSMIWLQLSQFDTYRVLDTVQVVYCMRKICK